MGNIPIPKCESVLSLHRGNILMFNVFCLSLLSILREVLSIWPPRLEQSTECLKNPGTGLPESFNSILKYLEWETLAVPLLLKTQVLFCLTPV